MTLQFGASVIDNARSVNYDHNTFIIQATDHEIGLIILLKVGFLKLSHPCLVDAVRGS